MAAPQKLDLGARKCSASLINLVFIDNARSSHPPPSLGPCIRQRFTFLEARGAAIITRGIYLKVGPRPISGMAADCPCVQFMRAPHRCGNWTIPVTARHTAHYLSRIIMNWFVNENTCFPPLASIYAFYRVHPPSLSIHPLSGHPSASTLPISAPQPSRQFVPSHSVSAIVSVYRVHIIAMTLRRYGDPRREKSWKLAFLFASGRTISISRRITIICGEANAWTNECVSIRWREEEGRVEFEGWSIEGWSIEFINLRAGKIWNISREIFVSRSRSWVSSEEKFNRSILPSSYL